MLFVDSWLQSLSYAEPPDYLLDCIVIVLAGLSQRRGLGRNIEITPSSLNVQITELYTWPKNNGQSAW